MTALPHRSAFGLALVLAGLMLTSSHLVAQQTPPLMTAPRPADRPATPAAPPALGPLGDQPALPPLTAETARPLIGHRVRTDDGTAEATIHDFTLGGRDEVADAVLGDVGGDARLRTVPAAKLRIGADGSVRLVMTGAEVSAAPDYRPSADIPTLNARK